MMPGSSGEQKSMYYSFDYSNVHFISLSTETSYPDAPFGSTSSTTKRIWFRTFTHNTFAFFDPPDDFGDELSWLEADLIQANQNRCP
jgi:hypothetical protein